MNYKYIVRVFVWFVEFYLVSWIFELVFCYFMFLPSANKNNAVVMMTMVTASTTPLFFFYWMAVAGHWYAKEKGI